MANSYGVCEYWNATNQMRGEYETKVENGKKTSKREREREYEEIEGRERVVVVVSIEI